jgi:putative ABC transport system permease protein
MLTAFVLIQVLIPVYGSITDTNFHINIFNWQLWKVLLMMIGGIWLLSGLYPALLLSSFRPVQALRGTGIFANTGLIRKSLVVLQFVVSISLALGTIFIHRQMSFIRNTDLALNPNQVIVFETWRLKGNGPTEFKDQLERMAGVTNHTIANASVFDGINSNMSIEWPGMTEENKFQIADFQVDKNFLQFFEIKMKEGIGLDNVSAGSKQWILNEAAVRKMGLKNPVGQPIKYRGEQGAIIGVVKDFHFRSMRDEMMPLLMQYNTEEASMLYARVTPQDTKKVIAAATQVWKKYEAIMPMDYHLLDEQIAQQYDSETKASYLFDAFAIVTMLISCLGLFGLTTYSAERRVKEIGIRKVLGAGVGRIAILLSKEFVRLVIIATVIAIPIVWYSMTRLLENFAYRTSLSWWVFALAALGAINLALITMSFQAIRAGMANPVKSLRTE